VITSTYSELVASREEYDDYRIRYIRTVDFGTKTQVVLTMQSASSTDSPVQVLAFYDKKTTDVVILSHQVIAQSEVSILSSIPKPQIQTQVIAK
jgi:hypothetical protein